MKLTTIRNLVILVTSTCAMPMASQAIPLTIAIALGRDINGVSANAAEDEAMVNSIVDRANGAATSLFDIIGKTYQLLNDPAPIIPQAVFVSGGGVGATLEVDLGAGGYRYLSVKYDGADGTLLIWDVSGLTGIQTVPDNDGQHTPSNYNLFNAVSTPVPDGGTTAALLGLALTGLGLLRRKLN